MEIQQQRALYLKIQIKEKNMDELVIQVRKKTVCMQPYYKP